MTTAAMSLRQRLAHWINARHEQPLRHLHIKRQRLYILPTAQGGTFFSGVDRHAAMGIELQ